MRFGGLGIAGGTEAFDLARVPEAIKHAVLGLAANATERLGEHIIGEMERELPGYREMARDAFRKLEEVGNPEMALWFAVGRFLDREERRGRISAEQREFAESIVRAVRATDLVIDNPDIDDNKTAKGATWARWMKIRKGDKFPREICAGLLLVDASFPEFDKETGKRTGNRVSGVAGVPVSDACWELKGQLELPRLAGDTTPNPEVKYFDTFVNPDKDTTTRLGFNQWKEGVATRGVRGFVNQEFRAQWEREGHPRRLQEYPWDRPHPKTFDEDLALYGEGRAVTVMVPSLGIHSLGSPEAKQAGVGQMGDFNPFLDADELGEVQKGGVDPLNPAKAVLEIAKRTMGSILAFGGVKFGINLLENGVAIDSAPGLYALSLLALGVGLAGVLPALKKTLWPEPYKVPIVGRAVTLSPAREGERPISVNTTVLNLNEWWERKDQLGKRQELLETAKFGPNIPLLLTHGYQQQQQIAVKIRPRFKSGAHAAQCTAEWLAARNLFAYALNLGFLAFTGGATTLAAGGVAAINQPVLPPPEIKETQVAAMAEAAPGLLRMHEPYQGAAPGQGDGNVVRLVDKADPRYDPNGVPAKQPYVDVGVEHCSAGFAAGTRWAENKGAQMPSAILVELHRQGPDLSSEGSEDASWALAQKDPDQFVREMNNGGAAYATGFLDAYCMGIGLCVIPQGGDRALSPLVETANWQGISAYLIKYTYAGKKLLKEEQRSVDILAKYIFDYYSGNKENLFTQEDAIWIFSLLDRQGSIKSQNNETAGTTPVLPMVKGVPFPRPPRELPGEKARATAFGQRQAQRPGRS